MSKVKFITNFSPALPSIEGLFKKHIHYLHSDEVLKKFFPNKIFSVIYKINNNVFCGTARQFYNKCCSPNNKHAYLKIQIVEQVINNNQFSIEDLLWEREKNWQAQLFANLNGMNNINDLYSIKRKGYRK